MFKTLFLFFLFLPASLWAQSQSNLIDELYQLNTLSATKLIGINKTKGFYKKHLSVQFSATCQFSTSCSVFMHDATSQFGFIQGSLLGIDRLTRCGLSEPSYNFLPSLVSKQSGLFIDAVYYYENH